MEDIVRDLNILWRAESIVAEIRIRDVTKRLELRAFAALTAVFALLMLNLAGFFGFQQWWGPVWASLAMAALDLAVAALMLTLAAAAKPGRDLALARDVRQAALESLAAHAQGLRQEAASLRDDIGRMRATLAGLAHNPLDTILPTVIVPLARALLKTLRKQDATPA